MHVRCIYEDPDPEAVVLWLPVYEPLKTQIDALKRRLGRVKIVRARYITPEVVVISLARQHGAKVIVVELPISYIARLVEYAKRNGIDVLMIKMKTIAIAKTWNEAEKLVNEKPGTRIATIGISEGYPVFEVREFEGYEKIVEIRAVTEPW